MRILVTGGCGFIGSYLVKKLVELNEFSKIVVVDIRDCRFKDVEFYKMDIRDKGIRNIVEKVDVVIHLAALINVEESILNPKLYHDVNVNGTLNILDSCIGNEVKIIFTSSAAVYGDPKYLPIDEKHPLNPLSPYGASKVSCEAYISAYHYSYDIDSIILRLFNVYGYGQKGAYAGVITKFIENILENRALKIFGDGEQTRDFIYIEDVVDAIVKAIKSNIKFDIFNVGTGKPLSINRLAEIVLKIAGKNVKVIHEEPRRGDIRHSYADIGRIKRFLNWSPRIDIETGLTYMFKEYLKHYSKESLDF